LPGVLSAYWGVVAFLFGSIVGSFLNVVIYRLPLGRSISHPGSHCPSCNRPLKAYENIPLVSFLALGAKCRTCKSPISWRYFGVELLTACTFLALYLHFGPTVQTVAYCLFAAAMIGALFTDLATFLIPDELNTFALLVGIGYDVYAIATRLPGHDLVWGFLPRSIFGAIICAGVFVLIQIMGIVLFRKEAMGDGDVKLARAIGALLPLSQALVSFFFATCVGMVFGIGMLIIRGKSNGSEDEHEDEHEDNEEEGVTVAEWLMGRLMYLTFFDLLLQFGRFLKIKPLAGLANRYDPSELPGGEEDDFVPGPTHIPFGPYMVVGALLAVFVGDRVIHWYMVWSHLAPVTG
jgi:leader peptidase (prepilin peptidase)/N-methyltransferase